MNTDELRHLETNTATIERLTRERDQAVARAEAAERSAAAMRGLVEEFGYNGNGVDDHLFFYCPKCKEHHEDWSKIPHAACCPIRQSLSDAGRDYISRETK